MKLETAERIVELIWKKPRNTVEAIKILRYETHFDLEEARDYLNRGQIGGHALLVRLVADFVETSETQLDTAKRMASYWNQRVEELTAEVQENADRYAYTDALDAEESRFISEMRERGAINDER